MRKLNHFSKFDTSLFAQAAESYGTPLYMYDEAVILDRCKLCTTMPNAFGLTVRYAMKANSNRTLLKIINKAGLHIDASSLNEAIRANLAGIPYDNIMLTTQEIHLGEAGDKLRELMIKGMKYNVCSLRQLHLIGDFASENGINPGIRVHPGIGSGESSTRNTGDEFSCFGIHLSDVTAANDYAKSKGIRFTHVHEHIGSGADSLIWQQCVDVIIGIVEEHFPHAQSVSFGGGLKEARMADEKAADPHELGLHAKQRLEEFYSKTGRKLHTEIEPGTYVVANSGYALTRVIDKKSTLSSNFVMTDGGIEINSRPLVYGSRHPIYILSDDGKEVKSSEFNPLSQPFDAVIVGKLCETGDCQTLDVGGVIVTRAIAEPELGDFAVFGGVGAYSPTMSPGTYNSHTQVAEVLIRGNSELELIRKRQTLEQVMQNEL